MDLRETTRPVLHPLVEQLLADERLAAYADALPAPARVSEPALPLLLAALHELRSAAAAEPQRLLSGIASDASVVARNQQRALLGQA